MESLGYPVYRIKLAAFTLSGAAAGLAGALLANHNLFISPSLMHWTQSANLLIMVLVGGIGLRHGGVAGAVVMLTLEEVLRLWTEYWHLPLGVLLLGVVFAPRGLVGLLGPWFAGDGGGQGGIAMNAVNSAVPALEARGLVRRFGALVATDQVSLSLAPGEIHALIGPNGAGKSTLIHLLSGTLAADAGTLLLGGRDVTGMNARVAAGLSRSYQITNIFKQSSVLDNLVLAVQAHAGSSFRFWRPRAAETALYEQARELARECAIDASLLERPAGTLPHGEQRKVEFALALAARPAVLLLDEPMAGMGPDETLRLTELIEAMRGPAAMLLVEHDMQAVFRLADRISVLVYGRVIATGTPDEIRANADVRQAYLGDEETAPARQETA